MGKLLDTMDLSDLSHLRLLPHKDYLRTPIIGHYFPTHAVEEPKHDHDFFEIQICASGQGWQMHEKGDFRFKRGRALLIRPGAWHYHHKNEQVECYICCFGAEILKSELIWTLENPVFNQLLWRDDPLNQSGVTELEIPESILVPTIKALQLLIDTYDESALFARYQKISYLTLILSYIAESYSLKNQSLIPQNSNSVHPAIKRCIGIIEDSISAEWSTNNLAEKLNIAPSYLCRLFKKALDLSPIEYLTQTRARRASHLLLNTDKPISQIGIEVGWPDPNYFARRFKTSFGVSASEYRKRQKSHLKSISLSNQ